MEIMSSLLGQVAVDHLWVVIGRMHVPDSAGGGGVEGFLDPYRM